MSRIPYRGGPPDDYGYAGRGDNRWDGDRFAGERGGGRSRFDSIDSGRGGVYEERDSRVTTRGGGGRPRERSIDELYERRGSGIGDDRYERKHYHDDNGGRYDSPFIPQRERESDPFDRRNGNVTMDRDEFRPQRRTPRPGFLRRQSSLDTFDRKPLTRYVEREEYGPPARYRDDRAVPSGPIPLPRTRQLGPPPGQYREEVRESDYYDEGFAPVPERVREREVVRRRRRSRDSVRSHSRHGGSVRSHSRHGGSVRSDSIGSSSSSDRGTVRSEFPKRGKTRMPARLVSKKAIIDLNYPFEEEGDTIVIMRALGRENIDEIIKLSEDYNSRSAASTTIIEERQEIISIPPPPPTIIAAPPPPPIIVAAPPPPPVQEIITDTQVVEHFDNGHHHHHHGSGAPIIVNAPHPSSHYGGSHRDHVTEIREVTHIDDRMALAPISSASRSEAAIRAEIRALELEKESLRRDRRRRGKSVGHADLVVYDEQRFHNADEDITVIRKEKIIEPDGGVRIEKDRKGRLAISVPKYLR